MSYLGPPVKQPVKIDPKQTRVAAQWRHNRPLIGARFDPTGTYVFAGSEDNSVLRFETATGKKTVYAGHKSWVRALAFAAKEGLLFSADWAGRVIAWPVEGEKPAPKWTVAAHRGWARALAVSPDGKALASCGNDGKVKLWSVPDGKPLRELKGHDCHVYNVAFHPDGKQLVSADLKGNVKAWDLAKGEVVRELDAKALYKYDQGFRADIGGVRGMAFSADGSLLACAGITNVSNAFAGVGNPLVVLFDYKAGKQKLRLEPKVKFQGTAWGVVFHPQGYLLGVGGGNGGMLWAWKTGEAKDVFALKLPNNARDLDLHPDGRRLAVPFYDGGLRLYDMGPKGA